MTRETQGIILDIVREAKLKLEDLPGPEYAEALSETARAFVRAFLKAQSMSGQLLAAMEQQESGARQ